MSGFFVTIKQFLYSLEELQLLNGLLNCHNFLAFEYLHFAKLFVCDT